MGAPERPPGDPLEHLAGKGSAPFFPLVALVERLTGTVGRLGSAGAPGEEAIRFRHDPSLGFSAADVTQVKKGAGSRVEVRTTFLGLSGAVTPLPLYLAEEVAQEDADRPVRRAFLDLFHHRLVSLLYAGVTSHLLTHAARHDAQDPWSRRLLALLGFDTTDLPVRSGLGPGPLLRLAPLLVTRNRTARALTLALDDVLSDVLGEGGVSIRQFVGSWVEIEPSQRMSLGRANSALGRSAVLGRRAYDRTGKIELVLGPMSRAAYERFLPGGDLLARVREVIELFSRDVLEYSVVLRLRAEEAPKLKLSSSAGSRLGRDSWVGTPPTQECRVTLAAA
jgi:type VI secretion system protein ImpH